MSQGATKIIYIKKKAKGGHGHHGGAWKVAYADFVTAMMALFIVLWLLTQTDTSARAKIAQYFRTGVLPGGSMVAGRPAGSNPPVGIDMFPEANANTKVASEQKQLQDLKKDVENMLKSNGAGPDDSQLQELAKHVSVKLVNEGALIELVDGGDSFMFPVASSSLKPMAVQLLQKLAPLLAKADHKLEIHGHTDSRPYDTKAGKSNWDLSYDRANKARQVLEGYGLPAGKINGVLAHADSALMKPEDPYAPENRRLSILVVRAGHERSRAGIGPDPNEPAPADAANPTAPAEGHTPNPGAAAPEAKPVTEAHDAKPVAGEHAPEPAAAPHGQ